MTRRWTGTSLGNRPRRLTRTTHCLARPWPTKLSIRCWVNSPVALLLGRATLLGMQNFDYYYEQQSNTTPESDQQHLTPHNHALQWDAFPRYSASPRAMFGATAASSSAPTALVPQAAQGQTMYFSPPHHFPSGQPNVYSMNEPPYVYPMHSMMQMVPQNHTLPSPYAISSPMLNVATSSDAPPLAYQPQSPYISGPYPSFPTSGMPIYNDRYMPVPQSRAAEVTSAPHAMTNSQTPQPVAQAPPRIRIPQTLEVTTRASRTSKVEFRINGILGVSVKDAREGYLQLDNGEDRVFASNGSRQIHLVIKWPGYPEKGMYIPVQDKDGFLTRNRFASAVGHQILRFVTAMGKQRIQGNKQWAIGKGGKRGILADDLWLLYVMPAAHNIWMAELEVQQ